MSDQILKHYCRYTGGTSHRQSCIIQLKLNHLHSVHPIVFRSKLLCNMAESFVTFLYVHYWYSSEVNICSYFIQNKNNIMDNKMVLLPILHLRTQAAIFKEEEQIRNDCVQCNERRVAFRIVEQEKLLSGGKKTKTKHLLEACEVCYLVRNKSWRQQSLRYLTVRVLVCVASTLAEELPLRQKMFINWLQLISGNLLDARRGNNLSCCAFPPSHQQFRTRGNARLKHSGCLLCPSIYPGVC